MSQNINPSSNLEPNLWSDSLLVKDESGQIHPWHQEEFKPGTALSLAPVLQPAVIPVSDKFIPVPKIGSAKSVAKHAFHPEDEEELSQLATTLPSDDSKKYSLEKIVDKLIKQNNLHLKTEDYTKFSDIFFDFFRNRKNAIVIREDLSRKILTDENILSEDLVDTLVGIAKVIKENISKSGGLVVKEAEMSKESVKLVKDKLADDTLMKPILSSADQPEIAKLEKEINTDWGTNNPETTQTEIENILEDLQDKKTTISEAKPETKKELPSQVASNPIVQEPEAKPATLAFIEPITVDLPKVNRAYKVEPAKKTVADVLPKKEEDLTPPAKAPVNLTGPVEELSYMTLQNFRRLANSPAGQAEKILNKIFLLEKESVTKKAQGIEAWRSSDVYRLYLELGEESLKVAKDIATIIQDRLNNGQDTLSVEEFSAISDLNKNLRF